MKSLSVYEKVQTLSEQDNNLIRFAQSNCFPYFFQEATHELSQFAHVLMIRNQDNLPVSGTVNSDMYSQFEDFFVGMCLNNGIFVDTILRASINCTAHYPRDYGHIHVDHSKFEHYNFLFYMNEIDGGDTYIFDDSDNVIKTIKHEKNKMVVFNGHPHAQGFCHPGQHRFVLVFTFLGEKSNANQ